MLIYSPKQNSIIVFCKSQSQLLNLLSGVKGLSNSVGNDVHFLSAVRSDNSGELLFSRLFIFREDAEAFKIVKGESDDLSSSSLVVSSLDSVSFV